MPKHKDVLTTGEVAKICNVAPRTVSKWFDSGQLRGYRIPGSKDRRIPLAQLVRFMKAHGIPLSGLETGQTRILVVDDDRELTDLLERALSDDEHYETRVAASAVEAGVLLERFRPNILLVETDLSGVDGRALSRLCAGDPELQGTILVAMGASVTDGDRETLLQQGFHNTIRKPFSIQQLTELIEETLAVAS